MLYEVEVVEANVDSESFASDGSISYTIMHVILSVPVPSDIVISPLAIPWSIISSIINDVSPGGFNGLSDFSLAAFRELFPGVVPFTPTFYVFDYFNAFGPLLRAVRTNFAAYALVKQSQMPSHATIMKS